MVKIFWISPFSMFSKIALHIFYVFGIWIGYRFIYDVFPTVPNLDLVQFFELYVGILLFCSFLISLFETFEFSEEENNP